MAVTTQYSELGNFQNGTTSTAGAYFGDVFNGQLKVARVVHAQDGAGDSGSIVYAAKLPPGRVLLLGALCNVYVNWTTVSATMDVGWAAYTGQDGVAVIADPDGLDDGLDVDTAGAVALGSALAANGGTKLFTSKDGVWITFKSASTAIADGDDLDGYLVYVAAGC